MAKIVTLMDVYSLYQIHVEIFSFLRRFGGIGTGLLKTLLEKLEAVGRAYCEENNLPYPLPLDQQPENLSGDLSQVVLGPKATQAFLELKELAGHITIQRNS